VSAHPDLPGAVASSLLAPLIDGTAQDLRVVHRSGVAWQLADERGRVVLSVITAQAIRLPHAVVVPSFPRGSSPISAGGGSLGWDGSRIRIARWFEPARPILPFLYDRLDPDAVDALTRRWPASIGRGDGLTPYHDDVVCGALAALSAAGHASSSAIAREVDAAPLERQTTALSAALLRFAARGYCIDPLARFLTAIAAVDEPAATAAAVRDAHAALTTVGHSSGRGLAEGVLTMLGGRGLDRRLDTAAA
jgi:Protein of unknown function (DUF2877)